MNKQVEQIKAEIKRIIGNMAGVHLACEYNNGFFKALHVMLNFINSLQEESVSEDLEEASKEWLSPQLDKSYATYGETKQMELTHFDGYAMLDAIEFGAKWQKEQEVQDGLKSDNTVFQKFYEKGRAEMKEQMMKDAIPARVSFGQVVLQERPISTSVAKDGDKVKIIIVKEEEI